MFFSTVRKVDIWEIIILLSDHFFSFPLTGKLLSRSQKMAYNLLTRLGGRGEGTVMPGDRVALVYPNNDPVSFMCAFYACLQAGLVPVPIEVPLSRRDAGSQQVSGCFIGYYFRLFCFIVMFWLAY